MRRPTWARQRPRDALGTLGVDLFAIVERRAVADRVPDTPLFRLPRHLDVTAEDNESNLSWS